MTSTRSVEERLDLFLKQETLALTVSGALGRNPTYCDGVSDKAKSEFRKSLRENLDKILQEYRASRVEDGQHVANIEALSSALSKCHHRILKDGKFRIGSAQKALNLYLKYGWARGIIREPPHCPIDRIVLDELKKRPSNAGCQICRETTWTKMDTIEEYLHFIDKARAAADERDLSLACWELEIWESASS